MNLCESDSKMIRRFAFTLTEVLAVAAIVAAIPSSSYQNVKQKTYQTECIHNLQQIGQMLNMYVLENGEFPKAAFFPKDAVKGKDSVRTVIGGPAALWVCPSLPDALKSKGLTFVYNDSLGGKSSIPDAAKSWALVELNCVTTKSPAPHPGGYNILYADGHVTTSKKLPGAITAARQ